MEDKRTREEKNKEIFRVYPSVDLIAVTSDDKAFIDLEKALSHGATLKNSEVKRYKRPASDAVKDLEAAKAKAEKEAKISTTAKAKEPTKSATAKKK